MPEKNEVTKTQDDLFKLDVQQLDMIHVTKTPAVQNMFDEIKDMNDKAKKLAKTKLDDLDQEEIDNFVKASKDLKKRKKKVEDAAKAVNKRATNFRTRIADEMKQLLTEGGYDELDKNIKSIEQLNKDVEANRANKRWLQLKEHFDGNLKAYPDLVKYFPNTLGNFDYYRMTHPKMVSGAKTRKVTKKNIKELNDELYKYSVDLKLILDNPDKLSEQYQTILLDNYAKDPESLSISRQTVLEMQLNELRQNVERNVHDQVTIMFNDATVMQFLQAPAQDSKEFIPWSQALKREIDNIINHIDKTKYIKDNNIDQETLVSDVKALCRQEVNGIKERQQTLLANLKTQLEKEQAKKAQPQQPVQPQNPWDWLMQYVSSYNFGDLRTNQGKVLLMRDLILNFNKQPWSTHVKNPDDIMKVFDFIRNI